MIYGDKPSLMPNGIKIPDPLAIHQSGNRYLHGMANPLRFVDRNGLCVDRDAVVEEIRETVGLNFGPASWRDFVAAYLRLIGICIALIPIPGSELKYKALKAIANALTSTTSNVLQNGWNGWEDFMDFVGPKGILTLLLWKVPGETLGQTGVYFGVSTILDNFFKWFRSIGSDAAKAEWEAFQEMLRNKIT